MSQLKVFILLFFLSFKLFAIDVLVNKKDINFKEELSASKLYKTSVNNVRKYCTPLSIKKFQEKKYRASRYLKKGTVICTKDVYEDKNNKILFNFGAIQIEKPGKIIFENDEYIKIKRSDGKVEKIYKDGRIE